MLILANQVLAADEEKGTTTELSIRFSCGVSLSHLVLTVLVEEIRRHLNFHEPQYRHINDGTLFFELFF